MIKLRTVTLTAAVVALVALPTLGAHSAPASRGPRRAFFARSGGTERSGAEGSPRATEPGSGAEPRLEQDVDKILADARDALGGDRKVSAVKTISITGKAQRTGPMGNSVEQDFEMAFELPDKFMRKDVLANMGNMSIYRTMGFNKDESIFEIDQPPQLAGGGNIVMRFAGPGMPGSENATPEQQAAMKNAQLTNAKQDFTRLVLGMLAQSFATYPVTMTHAGQAESPDGKADIIQIKGEGGFDVKLFVDTTSHMPLMLSWMDREPMVRTVTQGGGRAMVAGGGRGDGGGRRELTEEDRERMKKEMEAARAEMANRPMVEFRLFYGDYKEVDGVRIPHKIQRTVAGKPVEEITFDKVSINKKIDPKKFQASK